MTDYYCDYKNGDDVGGSGTTGAPWKTLSKGLTAMANNDTLFLRGTDAEDEVYIENNLSTAKTGITIQNDVGHTPVCVSGVQVTAASFSKTVGQTNVYEAAYGGADYGVWHGSQILTETANVAACDALTNSYYDDDAGTLYVNVGGGAPSTVYVIPNARYVAIFSGVGAAWDGISVQWGGGALSFTAGGTLRNTTVQYCTGPFALNIIVNITGNGHVMHDCAISASRGYRIYLDADNVEIYNVVSSGLQMDGGTGVDIHDCAFSAIGLANASSGTLSYCTFIGGGHHFITFPSVHTGTFTVHHCYCVLPIGSGASYAHGIVIHSDGVINLYHIVIAYLNRVGGADEEAYYVAGDVTLTMRNCVAYECRIGIHEVAGHAPVYDLDNTGFYQCTFANYNAIGPGDQGANDVTADPLFTDPVNYDFTIPGTSPYRDTGAVVPGINDGYAGSAPDIGRYEYREIFNSLNIPSIPAPYGISTSRQRTIGRG